MRQLFLDANIILDFFRFGKDDISEMEKLLALINGKEIRLLTNSHLRVEVERNREKVLASSLQALQQSKFEFNPPKICTGFTQLDAIRKQIGAANKELRDLIEGLKKKALAKDLPADDLIISLFEASTNDDIGTFEITAAEKRVSLGNPPGKAGSIGDACHWEYLLAKNLYDLDLISRDGDFSSPLDDSRISEFLLAEWRRESQYKRITLYKTLTSYFEKNFPQIKLSEEVRKNELIEQLSSSTSFSSTHDTISQLNEHRFFTVAQVVRLFEILLQNNQVSWISMDQDVRDFYLRLESKAYHVPTEWEDEISKLLSVDRDDFFLPF